MKTCADCANVFKYIGSDGKPRQDCETYGWGTPVNCAPPYDEPCRFFSETEKFDNRLFEKFINSAKEQMDD